MSFFRQERNRRFNPVIRPKKHRSIAPQMPAVFSRIPAGALIGGGVASVGLFALAGIIFFSGQFAIHTVHIEGASPEQEAIIQEEVVSWSASRSFGFIPRATLLFPASSLEDHLFQTFPRLKSVAARTEPPHDVRVTVSERARDGIWCASGTQQPQCFFYGEDGVIFEEAPNNARGFLLRFIRDERRTSAQAGERVLNEDDMRDITVLYAAFENGFEAPSYIVVASDQEARVGFLPNWEALLSRDEEFIPQVENVALVVTHRVGGRRGELEYIDARLGSRLFYKYRSLPPVGEPIQEDTVIPPAEGATE